MRFDGNLKDRIQQANDIVDVISEHLRLERKGKELAGLCPFHQDHRPSMMVSPEKQIFKCFACGAGGDVIKFVQLRENLSFPEALERLAERANIPIERNRGQSDRSDSAQSGPGKKVLVRANGWALKLWQRNIWDEQKGEIARNYVHGREISESTAREWGLGFALDSWDDLCRAAKVSKVPEQVLIEGGLAVERDSGGIYDKFRNRLMFPIADVTGRVIGFGGRTLGDAPAKYMNSPATALFDKSNSVYGLDKARHEIVQTGTAVVVEGYTDVIMCHQFGCKNVIATLGTSFTSGHARLLQRYAKQIVLVFDSDVAGMEAANRALEVCLAQKIDIKLAFVEEGKDPCDYLLTAGKEAFLQVIENARDVMEFKWDRLVKGLENSDNLADRRAAAEEYLRSFAAALDSGKIDSISRGLLVNKLSRIIGLSVADINAEIGKMTGRIRKGGSFSVKNQQVRNVSIGEGLKARAQAEMLEVLLNEPKLIEEAQSRVGIDVFDVPVMREIAGKVFAKHGKGQTGVSTVIAEIESPEVSGLVLKLQEAGERKGNYRVRFEEAVEAIEYCRQQREKEQIKASMAEDDRLRELAKMLGKKNHRNPGLTSG
ncbi:DNA primase [Anaerohalosphaera lusitana]|uniref:DNA primase n=1 Tax=Anaerohalosphaera lusitana TaxID=1936003 RepID=A0A1U9NLC8_9BACT|nr:DNA primase [Anaerohalosphaera lusitana]AQT68544.1 DNA primase [Anaerohalosphaera lusitana]